MLISTPHRNQEMQRTSLGQALATPMISAFGSQTDLLHLGSMVEY
jgi:hypothetical protein